MTRHNTRDVRESEDPEGAALLAFGQLLPDGLDWRYGRYGDRVSIVVVLADCDLPTTALFAPDDLGVHVIYDRTYAAVLDPGGAPEGLGVDVRHAVHTVARMLMPATS